MKNILFITDGFTNGGLESRIASEVSNYSKRGIKSFLACQTFNQEYRSLFNNYVILKELPQDSQDFISVKKILKTRDRIISFCASNHIDFIECEPFWCVLPAALASQKAQIPISFTLHGLNSGNFISNNHAATKAIFYLALKYGFDQIFSVAEYLQQQYSFLSSNIIITRNGTELNNISPRNHTMTGHFAISSRLDAPKTDLIIDFLPLIHDLPNVHSISIFGEGNSTKTLKDAIIKNNYHKVTFKGWQDNPIQEFQKHNYDAIFGMGRVILDAISSGTPAGVLGYGGFAGFVTKQNIRSFASYNLTSWNELKKTDIPSSITEVQKDRSKFLFKKKDLHFFDDNLIWQVHFTNEEKIKFRQKPTIDLLNHILEKNSFNNKIASIDLLKTFTESFNSTFDNVFQILYYLALNSLMDQITIDNLNKTIQEQAKTIENIHNSTSWKITKPIRKIFHK